MRAAWKTPPISPVRPPSAPRRRDPDPGGLSNPRGDESSRSTRPGKFVSKLQAEAHLASSGVVSSVTRPSVHGSSSDSGLNSWSTSVATAAADVSSTGIAARNKSGCVVNDNNLSYSTFRKIYFRTCFIPFWTNFGHFAEE